jgi:hypothetical protein
VALTGPLSVTLFVSSNATDTDFAVTLIDVYPANSSDTKNANASILVADGITRMRWRNAPGVSVPQLLTPGAQYQISVDLWNTSYVFSPGHRIRVHVTSSNYPRFDVNPNNGLPLTQSGPNVTASNTLYTSLAAPSAINLPIVQLSQLPKFDVLDAVEPLAARFEPRWRAARAAAAAKAASAGAAAAADGDVKSALRAKLSQAVVAHKEEAAAAAVDYSVPDVPAFMAWMADTAEAIIASKAEKMGYGLPRRQA